MNRNSRRSVWPLTLALASGLGFSAARTVQADTYSGTLPVTLDRWNYPFGDFGGSRSSAPTFWTVNTPGFDDRDAEFLIGFDTSALVPTGLPSAAYGIQSLVITASVVVSDNNNSWIYDPTHDLASSYYDSTDPLVTLDADAGRPVELFACGYRATSSAAGAPLWSATTFLENSPFASTGANPPPARNNRNVFPVSYDQSGIGRNCANHISGTAAEGGRFEATPLAVGQANLAAGASVPNGTVFTFTVDCTKAGVREYVQEHLASGRVNFIISSLHPSVQPGTGAQLVYPIWSTKENPFGQAATLQLEITTGGTPACLADINTDGVVDGSDFVAFINSFAIGDVAIDAASDVNTDGIIDGNDFVAFINAFALGC